MIEGRVGLALGSGAARGWAHVGVIRALEDAGLRPAFVCGASTGAIVGAMYAAGKLDHLEKWGRQLDWRQVAGFFDISLRGGLIRARRLIDFLTADLADRDIQSLEIPFATVATDLETGREVWLRRGVLIECLHAAIALPGLVTPVRRGKRWLVDGGLVNPVPVSLCRAMGADTVVAVDLNTTLLRRPRGPEKEEGGVPAAPAIYDVVARSINVMQAHITRSRMAGEPPDVLITPRLPDYALLDFQRAEEAIEEGRRATARALSASAPA